MMLRVRDVVGAVRLAKQGQADQAVWWLIGCLAAEQPVLLAPALLARLHPVVKAMVKANQQAPITAGRLRGQRSELDALSRSLVAEVESPVALLPDIRAAHRRHLRRRYVATLGAGLWLASGYAVHVCILLLVGSAAPFVIRIGAWLAVMALLLLGPLFLWRKADIRLGAYERGLRAFEPAYMPQRELQWKPDEG
ncbi:MAG: hypothetical protein ACK46X_19405 [Candidatus Sericytochromatia bacterium]